MLLQVSLSTWKFIPTFSSLVPVTHDTQLVQDSLELPKISDNLFGQYGGDQDTNEK